jgi:hypothetical protein
MTDEQQLANQLDKAGQAVLELVRRASGIAEENSRHALGTAQKLSERLTAAQTRVAELEEELASFQERAERAEQWLHRLHGEIEGQFHAISGGSQRPQNARPPR